jgi:superfamily II DNA helicase RecQ
MPLKFFLVPAFEPAAAETEINAFLGSHRVVAIDRRFVDQGVNSFWALCVDHLPSGAGDGRRGLPLGRNRIDYKQVLSADEFVVFSRLRELRKEIAQQEAVPVYAVFTNEQLAQAVQQRCRSAADLGRIDGVGQARVEKYADQLLGILASMPDVAVPEATDATGRQSV